MNFSRSYVFSSLDSSSTIIKLNEFGQLNGDNSVSFITGSAKVSYIDSFIGLTEFQLLYSANATAYNVKLGAYFDFQLIFGYFAVNDMFLPSKISTTTALTIRRNSSYSMWIVKMVIGRCSLNSEYAKCESLNLLLTLLQLAMAMISFFSLIESSFISTENNLSKQKYGSAFIRFH